MTRSKSCRGRSRTAAGCRRWRRRVSGGRRDEPLADAAVDRGMDDRFERGARARDRRRRCRPERGAVERAVRRHEHAVAETRAGSPRGQREPGGDGFARERVGVDHRRRRARRIARGRRTSRSRSRRSARPRKHASSARPVAAWRVPRRRCSSAASRSSAARRRRAPASARPRHRRRAGWTSPTTTRAAPARSLAAAASPAPKSFSTTAAIADRRRADVDHRRAGLDELRRHEAGPADRGDQDVGRRGDRRQVRRLRVADRDRRVALQQQHRHRLADDLAAPDDDRVRAGDRDPAAHRASR